MDNGTHTLVGLMLSRAGFGRFHKHAPVLMMLAANMPDCDVVSFAFGADKFLHYHRWYTHSIALAPVMAMVPLLVVWAFARKTAGWLGAYLISLVAVASHLLLDLTNPYGVRLFLPFSEAWPRLDITEVIDPWIWSVLFLAVAAPWISRLISSEIGGKSATGRGWAIFALLFLFTYDGWRWVLHGRAVAVQEVRIYEGETPRRVAAFPSTSNPMRWKGFVETDSAYYVNPIDLTGEFDPGAGKAFYKTENTAAMQLARQTPVFQDLIAFSPFLFWQVTPSAEVENAVEVEAVDLRFTAPPKSGFTAIALVQGNRVLKSWFRLIW